MAVRKGRPIKDVIRRDTRRVNVTWKDSDGVVIDLTGGTGYFTVNADDDPATDSTAIIQKTTTSFTDATAGEHTFNLTHSDTDITPGDYWYDAQFVDSAGSYLSSYRGEFSVQSDITRS